MTIQDFLPKYIKRIIADRARQTVTSEYWNELFNLLVNQGDWSQEAISLLMTIMKQDVLLKNNEIAWEPLNDYQPATVKFVTDRIGFMGGGDMSKAVYDVFNTGTVDDSKKLGGKLPNAYANTEHTHIDKADLVEGKIPLGQLPAIDTIPTSHASATTDYGVGSTAAYGHCKTIDDLTRSVYVSGEALSAKQGYKLGQQLAGKTVWVGVEDSKGTDANTIYFCY